ncbi:hypothetical protein GA0061098_101638 [Bradyrhizobium shewense]|uniref:Uncharacterized protein n=1 Tax=Bradyrhizobium shewense TaxID=1761772 RepID=A0A1C3XID3_9BRAD|nr:hypothetical protein GA0061098_101638 [Bradyrhizobium shewense]
MRNRRIDTFDQLGSSLRIEKVVQTLCEDLKTFLDQVHHANGGAKQIGEPVAERGLGGAINLPQYSVQRVLTVFP